MFILAGFLFAASVRPAFGQLTPIPLSSLVLNGSAHMNNPGYIKLTEQMQQAGSAFVATPYKLNATSKFTFLFVYGSQKATSSVSADGLAMVVQNAAWGASYLGWTGSGLGYMIGSPVPALAVVFDHYQNVITGTPAGTVAVVDPSGVVLAQTIPTPAVFPAGTMRYVWVTYDNSTRVLSVSYSDKNTMPSTPIIKLTLQQDLATMLGGQAYLGFTASTGALDAIQTLGYVAVSVN
jgi:hypothetical protein